MLGVVILRDLFDDVLDFYVYAWGNSRKACVVLLLGIAVLGHLVFEVSPFFVVLLSAWVGGGKLYLQRGTKRF